jgi:glycosyltransferase involved in cell wall biosynthesis
MKFSLVLATVGRVTELERFLSALASQGYRNFELSVVDQNPDDRVQHLLDSFAGHFQINRLRSKVGLSRARNAALPHVTGDVVAFPDDDCWYPQDLLGHVATLFSEHSEWGGVTGRPARPDGIPWPGWARGYGILTRRDALHRGTSYTIFLRRRVMEAVGKFDESLGAGAGTPWNWAEETDYLLRAMEQGFQIYDHNGLVVFHPYPASTFDAKACAKEYSQAVGLGHFLRTRRFPIRLSAYLLLRPLAGFLYYLGTGRRARAFHRWTAFRGRIKGYWST